MAEAPVRIGIDLGGTKIAAVALDAEGGLLGRGRVETPAGDYAATLEAIAGLVDGLEQSLGVRATVGLGTPGAPSRVDGRMKNCNSTWLNGRPLAEDLCARLGREVRLANDADCLAVSEASDGAAAGARVVFGVIVGTGCGGGIVVDGRPLNGPNAIAGEWGHNPLPWAAPGELPGPDCYCGRRGCIETWLSGPGLSRAHAVAGRGAQSAERIARAAVQGDTQAIASLEAYADRMARALAGVINILDPDVIVLGGGLSQIAALYTLVPARWQRYVFSDRVDTAFRPALHGAASGVRGAAALWNV
jgi:predicted NBD/HSP70 family sugar kinase